MEKITLSVPLIKALLEEFQKTVKQARDYINKINFFPIPDKDTGTNLLITISSIIDASQKNEYHSFSNLVDELLSKKYLLKSGKGNVGIIFSAYLAGFLSGLKSQVSLEAEPLARAMKQGESWAYRAIAEPREGTILDTISASANRVSSLSLSQKDLICLLDESLKEARQALAATTQKLEVLKKNKVVDAGAFGFVLFLESFLKIIRESSEKEGRDGRN